MKVNTEKYFLECSKRDITHFREVVIMATNCNTCGHRSNKLKLGVGIEPKGIWFEVKVRCREDFSQHVLKVRVFL